MRPRLAAKTTSARISILAAILSAMLIPAAPLAVNAQAQQQKVVITNGPSTIVLEPYAPNVIRVTLSLDKDQAVASPGYGIVASAAAEGWSLAKTDNSSTYSSPRMVVSLKSASVRGRPAPATSEAGATNVQKTMASIGHFFNGSTPGVDIRFSTPDGKQFLEMNGWQMSVPNYKDGNAHILNDKRPSDEAFYQVGATFASPADEHYYGLGQNQEGYLDHRGHTVECWNNYTATGGPTWCIPFAVTNKGYGLVWDNPSQTTIEPGFNEQTRWTRKSATAFPSS
jgi:alpha-D-xyloside xylohydrolase